MSPRNAVVVITFTGKMSGATASIQCLPKFDKQVDLKSLGNTLVQALLAELMNVSAVDKKFGIAQVPKEQIDVCGHNEWQFDYEKDGVSVFKEKMKSSKLNSFASRGVVSAPYTLVGEFLKDPQSAFVWDNFLVEAKYLKTYADTPTCQDYLAYQLHSATQCFSLLQRDLLYFVHCEHKSGRFIVTGVSVNDDDYPPQKSIPRCEAYPGTGFVVEPFRGSTAYSLVTYIAKGNLKGVPQLITTQLIRRHSMAIKYIQRSFEHQESFEQTHFSLPSNSVPDELNHSTMAYEEHLPISSFVGKTKQV